MAHTEPIRRTPSTPDIPDKLYFRIGDVAKLCEVPAYVLRFWESEFPQLKPNKGGTGQRLYRRKDVEMALRIKRLLYEEGYTISGARQIFKQDLGATAGPQLALAIQPMEAGSGKDVRRLRLLREELQELHEMLSGSVVPDQSVGLRVVRVGKPTRGSHGLALTRQNARPTMGGLFASQGGLLSESEPPVRD